MNNLDPLGLELHDSTILDLEMDSKFQNLAITLHAPYNQNLFVRIEFLGILRMEFETHLRGLENAPLSLSGIRRHRDDEEERFRQRIEFLEQDSPEDLAQSKQFGFNEVFHLSLEADVSHQGFGPKEGFNGIHLVCRRVTVQPVHWKGSIPGYSAIPGSPLDDVSEN